MAYFFEVLSEVLGPYSRGANDNYVFRCPFCVHHKPKLTIKVVEGSLLWHCWVCEVRGQGASALLDEAGASDFIRSRVYGALPRCDYSPAGCVNLAPSKLPKEARNLYLSENDTAQVAKEYLYRRGLSEVDVIRYNIQFCDQGKYSRRVIIPSYDRRGVLSSFVSRAYLQNSPVVYLNPPGHRDAVFFDSHINWSWPIVLCEGVFDAMAIKTNAIPLLGKRLPAPLRERLWSAPADRVYVVLDADAKRDGYQMCRDLRALLKEPYFVDLPYGDPASLGYDKTWACIKSAEKFSDNLDSNQLKNIIYGTNSRGYGGACSHQRAWPYV